MKIVMVIIVTSFLGLTACSGDSSSESNNASSNLFGNLDIACDSESCL